MTTAGNVLLIAFAIVVVIVDRMWRKFPKDHPAVYWDEVSDLICPEEKNQGFHKD
jgi:hypothetical protein